jgi:hypothetical protein
MASRTLDKLLRWLVVSDSSLELSPAVGVQLRDCERSLVGVVS